MPVMSRAFTETKATLEKRGTTTASPATRLPTCRLRHSTSSPIRPPIHSEPAATCTQSTVIASQRGEVWAACPAAAGPIEHRARGEQRSDQREQRRHRAHLPVGTIEPQCRRRREREQAERQLDVEVAAPERRGAHQRHEIADRPDRAEREVSSRNQYVDGRRNERDGQRDPERDRDGPKPGACDAGGQRPGYGDAQDEQADGGHDRQKRDPAGRDQPRRHGGLGQRRDDEARRRARGSGRP